MDARGNCKMDNVTWDATSKIVKTRLTDKPPLYYYELTVRNSTTGQISLPVAIMILSDQTQPTVQYWMSCFRNDEKRISRASNLSHPVQTNSDRPMVFIMTVVQVFNNETLSMFLDRSWRIVHGLASFKQLQLTVIHTCAFHFMHNAKEIVKKTMPSGARSVAMWMYLS